MHDQVREPAAAQVAEPQRAQAVPAPRAPSAGFMAVPAWPAGDRLRRSVTAGTDPLGGFPVPGDVLGVLRRSRGHGASLPAELESTMGTELGADLSAVRVHTGPESDRAARSLQAVAFADGPDLHFRRGAYAPGTDAGRRLLAHEVSHVTQPQAHSDLPVVGHADDPAERAADRSADRVVAALRRSTTDQPQPTAGVPATRAPGEVLRRSPADFKTTPAVSLKAGWGPFYIFASTWAELLEAIKTYSDLPIRDAKGRSAALNVISTKIAAWRANHQKSDEPRSDAEVAKDAALVVLDKLIAAESAELVVSPDSQAALAPHLKGDWILDQVFHGRLVVKPGESGDHVTKIQRALNDTSHLAREEISGTFDDKTEKALKRFQESRKTPMTKEIDAQGVRALGRQPMGPVKADTAKGTVVTGPDGQRFLVDKTVGTVPGKDKASQVPMVLLTPVGADQERTGTSQLVRMDDPEYVTMSDGTLEPKAEKPREGGASGTDKPPFDSPKQHSLEWWFNYFWIEISDSSKARATAVAKAHAAKPDIAAVTAEMEAMFNEGLIEITEQAGTVEPKDLSKGGDDSPAYKLPLPRLSGSGLGYRADTRQFENGAPGRTIRDQGGSKPIARVPALEKDKGFTESWNPFSRKGRRDKMYLRRVSADNALETVVSVAEDVRDTVTFPKPNQSETEGGGTATGGAETITVYVVFVNKALDTSGLANELFGAFRWQKGEVGAYGLGVEDHIAQFTVRRFYDPRVDSFVVGKVTDFKFLADQKRRASLPPAAAKALEELTTTFLPGATTSAKSSGPAAARSGWLRFQTGEKGNTRHDVMTTLWELSNEPAPTDPAQEAELAKKYQKVWGTLERLWPTEKKSADRFRDRLTKLLTEPWTVAPTVPVGNPAAMTVPTPVVGLKATPPSPPQGSVGPPPPPTPGVKSMPPPPPGSSGAPPPPGNHGAPAPPPGGLKGPAPAKKPATGAGTPDAALNLAVESFRKELMDTRLPWVRLRANKVVASLQSAGAEITALPPQSKDRDAVARKLATPVIQTAAADVSAIGVDIEGRKAVWAKKMPQQDATAAEWEEFLMDVLADTGP